MNIVPRGAAVEAAITIASGGQLVKRDAGLTSVGVAMASCTGAYRRLGGDTLQRDLTPFFNFFIFLFFLRIRWKEGVKEVHKYHPPTSLKRVIPHFNRFSKTFLLVRFFSLRLLGGA
ncbi:hypothetical protein LOD59_10355, partial [Xylella fastidiosa subsp. multiplex]|uniref:hypothetical protein n=1 Tax=Xylella fastidiosa TaxID=2371 RepID=UPI0023617C65